MPTILHQETIGGSDDGWLEFGILTSHGSRHVSRSLCINLHLHDYTTIFYSWSGSEVVIVAVGVVALP